MIWRRILSAEATFFVVAWLLILVLYREQAFLDPGAFWHVRVGEIILADGLMWTDPFTYTHAGETWIPQQWGGEVVMALAHRVAGRDALLWLFATGLAGVFTGIFRRMMAAGMGWPVAGGFTALVFFVGSFHYYVRPHMITIALLAWTMACVVDFDRGRAGLWRLAGLIPLFVIWTNVHAGVLAGNLTLGLGVATWLAMWVVGRDGPITSARMAGIVVLILSACGLTPLVNPFGLEMLRTWGRLVGSEVLPKIVVEHMPLSATAATGQVVLGLAVVYLMVLVGAIVPRPRSFRLTWLIPLVWFALAVKGIRHGPLFAVVTAVALADIWPRTIWHRYFLAHGDTLAMTPGPRPGWPTIVLPAIAVTISLGLILGKVEVPVVGRGWSRINPTSMPIDLNDAVRASIRRAGPDARLFNDANLGGYMIYFHPDQKIFMDDRCELYGDRWLQNYFAVITERPAEIEVWADKYGFDRALVESSLDDPYPLETYLIESPRWQIAPDGRGEKATLFERVPTNDR